jgi:hypothetical protein
MVNYPDKEHDEFYSWLGRCISRWAYTEDILFGLCQIALISPVELVAVVYYRTPTVDARTKLVEELVSATLPKPAKKSGGHKHDLAKRLEVALKTIRDLLETRNALAHHKVRQQVWVMAKGEVGKPMATEVVRTINVGPSENEMARGRKIAHAISLRDLKAHYPKIEDARQALLEFQAAWLEWRQQERLRQAPPDKSG